MVEHVYHSSIPEAETGGSPSACGEADYGGDKGYVVQ